MYTDLINKMAFSKKHKDLLLNLYNKQITRREYDQLVQQLYHPSNKNNLGKDTGQSCISYT